MPRDSSEEAPEIVRAEVSRARLTCQGTVSVANSGGSSVGQIGWVPQSLIPSALALPHPPPQYCFLREKAYIEVLDSVPFGDFPGEEGQGGDVGSSQSSLNMDVAGFLAHR